MRCGDYMDKHQDTYRRRNRWDTRLTRVAMSALALMSFVVAQVIAPGSASAISQNYITTYSDWSFGGSDVYNIDSSIVVNEDPGQVGSYFYVTHHATLNNGDAYYLGLQTDVDDSAGGKVVVFSIWMAPSGSPGPSANSSCAYNDESMGYSCRLRYNWVAGTQYRLRIWRTATNTWGAWILNTATGAETQVGTLVARANTLVNRVGNFVEYYGADFPHCSSLPSTQATFSSPLADNRSRGATLTGSSIGPGACAPPRSTTVATNRASVAHRMGTNPPACGFLFSGRTLLPGQSVYSCGSRYRLVHQTDGNAVLYDRSTGGTGTAIWCTRTWGRSTARLVMQKDGNLVLYSPSNGVVWTTYTYNNRGAFLKVQTDAKLVIYRADESGHLWESAGC
jgi:hypothetical protein